MTRFLFGPFTVDDDTVEIIGPDGARDVEPQVFDVLRYLVEERGRLVTKEELLDNVWGDRFVSESALTTRIKQARRAVDDDGATQWAIKTVHGRGYRFLPDVEIDDGTQGVAGSPATPSTPSMPLPDELHVDARRPFCGRDTELSRSADILDRPGDDSSSGWIWVLGEPGIGKTRLASEIARLARDREHRVLFGSNAEDLRVPYQPFIEVLRQSRETSPELPRALAPLVPDIGIVTEPSRNSESTVDNETRRYAMFEAVGEWLDELASTTPVTMIIDDVHWAADSTLQLLSHLQHRRGGQSVTFVLTSRDTAPDVNPRVSDLVATGSGGSATTVLRLTGLTRHEAAELVGDDLDVDEIMRQTAGNPLFLKAATSGDGSIDLQSAVHRRLASLDERIQDTLQTASILGLEFGLRVAATTLDRDELDLLDDLETAVAARLLDDLGHDRFRFTHALVRSSLRSELSSSRQARMHRRASIAIHEVFGDDDGHLLELAFHTAEAALVDRKLRPVAIERLRRAARESMTQFSFEEAAALFRRAGSLADVDDHRTSAQLKFEQGIAESRAGQSMTAARTFETVITLAGAEHDPVLRIEAAIRYEDATWRPGLPGMKALRLLREATATLDNAAALGVDVPNELELRARLAVGTLRALAMSGHTNEVSDAFQEAQRLALELDSPNVEANVLGVYLGQVMLYEGIHKAEPMVQRLAALEPLIDDGDVALHAIHDRILHATVTGQFRERRHLVQTMADLQERSHSRFWEFIRANQEAMEAFYAGDLDASESLADRCLGLAHDLPEEDGSGIYGLRMFLIRREQDRLATIAPMLRQVLDNVDDGAIWTPGLALLLVETGAPDEAAAALERVRSSGFDLPIDAMWSTVMVLLIETMVRLDDVEACKTLRTRFESQVGINVTTGSGLLCFGRAERYLGMLSLVIGDLDEAEQQLGIALEADDAGGSVLWRNESRWWLSLVRRAQGHVAEADAMLEVVAREGGRAGLRRLERLAREGLDA